MAITVNNGVQNILGTPGSISDVIANRPAAADLADGTLFFAIDTLAIYQTVSGAWVNYSGGGGGSQNLQQTLNIGNSAVDKAILLSSSTGLAYQLIYNPAGTVRAALYPTFTGVQRTSSDDYVYNTIAGTTPYIIAHNATGNRESRFYPSYTQYKDLTSGAILTVNAPASISNNTIDFQNASGTLAFLNDIALWGINSVLAVGEAFTNDRTMNMATFSLDMVGAKYINLQTTNQTGFYITDSYINAYSVGNALNGLMIDFAGAVYQIGDFAVQGNYISYQTGLRVFQLVDQYILNGLYCDFANGQFRFGNLNSGDYLEFNSSQNAIYNSKLFFITYVASGLSCNGGQTFIGDIDTNVNGTVFAVDDNNQTLIASGNLSVGSSGSSSGQHLKILVGGTPYVIELKNP